MYRRFSNIKPKRSITGSVIGSIVLSYTSTYIRKPNEAKACITPKKEITNTCIQFKLYDIIYDIINDNRNKNCIHTKYKFDNVHNKYNFNNNVS